MRAPIFARGSSTGHMTFHNVISGQKTLIGRNSLLLVAHAQTSGHVTSSSGHLTSGDVTSGSTTSHHLSSESGHYGTIDPYVKPFSPPDPPEITALTGTPVSIDNENIYSVYR
jgi:hypothetical protein